MGGDAVSASVEVDFIHERRAQIDFQGLEKVFQRNAEHEGFFAIDIGIILRSRRSEGSEGLHDVAVLAGGAGESPCGIFQGGVSESGAILDLHFETTTCAETANRWRWDDDSEGIDFLDRLGEFSVDDISFFPLGKRLEDGKENDGVGGVGERRAVESGEADHVLYAIDIRDELDELLDDLVGAFERGAGGKLSGDDGVALILRCDEPTRDGFEPKPRNS